MQRGFNAFKFNSTLGGGNGTKGEESGGGEETRRWTAVSVSCVFLRPLHGKLATFAPPRVDVCAQSGKRSRSVSRPALFFPSIPIDIHESVRSAAERPPGMGLSNVASGRRSPFYFAANFSFLGFLSPVRAICVSFLSHVPQLYGAQARISPCSSLPLPCTVRRRLIKKRIHRYRRENAPLTPGKVEPRSKRQMFFGKHNRRLYVQLNLSGKCYEKS